MTRAEAARNLCERLARDVDAIAPAGIGYWAEAWEIVTAADTDFWVALSAWEATGAEVDRAEVRGAYNAVLDAWREATRKYERETA